DVLNGGDGNDVFLLEGTSSGVAIDGLDQYDGGAGVNSIVGNQNYSDILRVTNNLANLKDIQVLDGAGYWWDNRIVGSEGADALDFSGRTVRNFVIDAGGGNDVVTGTAGDDFIQASRGDDVLNGGDGNDVFLLEGTSSGVAIDGLDQYDGGAGVNSIVGNQYYQDFLRVTNNLANLKNIQVLDGAGYWWDNRIVGTEGADVLDFSGRTVRNFIIDGGAGNDVVTGTTESDHISGGAGDDMLRGGKGADSLTGGDGNDSYYWAVGDGADEITDNVGANRLYIEGVTDAASISVATSDSRYTVNVATASGTETLSVIRNGNNLIDQFTFVVNGQTYSVNSASGNLQSIGPTASGQAAPTSSAMAVSTSSYVDTTLVSPWAAMEASIGQMAPMTQSASALLQPDLNAPAILVPSVVTQYRAGSTPQQAGYL
ncbi:calcium-binding protein, partial [Roseateles sp. P5_E8]